MSMINIGGNTSTSKLTGIKEGDVQQNAVDLRLDRVWAMDKMFVISEEYKTHRHKTEVLPDATTGEFVLNDGVYEVTFENTITVGPDEAGWVITRSTLNRNGLFLTSGNYDSGYSGSMAACLHVSGGIAYIKKGTRIGQYLAFKAEALSQYDGSYGLNADGTLKADEARYHTK